SKCYLNENLCVITSLNLHLFSQQNNNEMGVMIKRATDQQLYSDVSAEVDRLIRISEPTLSDRENLVLESESVEYQKLTTAKLAKRRGIDSRTMQNKLLALGYLELRDGGKRYLTAAGKEAGGEFRKGPCFIWPVDLQV